MGWTGYINDGLGGQAVGDGTYRGIGAVWDVVMARTMHRRMYWDDLLQSLGGVQGRRHTQSMGS